MVGFLLGYFKHFIHFSLLFLNVEKCCRFRTQEESWVRTMSLGFLGGGFKHFLCSPRKLGKIPILTSIFFRWVGSTTNQFCFLQFLGIMESIKMLTWQFDKIWFRKKLFQHGNGQWIMNRGGARFKDGLHLLHFFLHFTLNLGEDEPIYIYSG